MKKLLFTSVSLYTLFVSACNTNGVSKINKGVRAIGKCCKELSAGYTKSAGVPNVEVTKEVNNNVSSILPFYFWDTKSMTW